jgi:uncharacterized protein
MDNVPHRRPAPVTDYGGPASASSVPLGRDEARAVFGQVMGLVALTLGFLALGAYTGRNLSGGIGIALFVGAFACLFGLNVAAQRDRQQVATTFLLGVGLSLGLSLGPTLSVYASADPSAIWQAAGLTGLFVAVLGTTGYATRRDLSAWYRGLFFALLAFLVLGIVATFVSIPHLNAIWSIGGLVIFGGFTVVDFNRLRRTGADSAVPIAASIFLDVLNVFLLLLTSFGTEQA